MEEAASILNQNGDDAAINHRIRHIPLLLEQALRGDIFPTMK